MQSSPPNKPEVEVTYNLSEIETVATRLAPLLGSQVVLVFGQMGAGKTTLIKAICRALGVTDEVSSPTFALVNEYQSDAGEPVYHFDLYRLAAEEEALDFGVDEYLDSNCLCLVEWPEKILNFLPPNFGVIILKNHDGYRKLQFFANTTTSHLANLSTHD
jgi:tRNA threonylcarbamoyladenosine biosynthesis protein TsaE